MIAITVVLIALLFGPLIQGFRLTAQAQTTVQAQDSARVAMEQISRELGSAAAVRDTTRQFLDLRMYTEKSGQPGEIVAHSYNAYLDIIPPRPASSSNNVVDPTVDPNSPTATLVHSNNANGGTVKLNTLASADLGLPIAPGTTIVRWFVGLRHPINVHYAALGGTPAVEQPYINQNENQTFPRSNATWGATETVQDNLNNPYILYRAQVSPYTQTKNSSGVLVWVVNTKYFDTVDHTPTGAIVLDDPDFFRVVPTGYVSPIDGTTLTAQEAADHNDRVYYWTQAAKPIIDINDVNLIFQPHDSKGRVVYNTTTNGWLSGSQADLADPSGQTPILRTSVNFEPAAVGNDALSATATSDVSQGYGTAPADALSPYIPAQYKATYGQWVGGPNIVVTGASNLSYSTYQYWPQIGGTAPADRKAGDLIESSLVGGTPMDVYDLRSGLPLNNSTQFVAMNVEGDSGMVNFAIPDIPSTSTAQETLSSNILGTADTGNTANPYYFITFGASDPNVLTGLQIHLENQGISNDPDLLPGAGLALPIVSPFPSGDIPNGRVVVNSERVYGPEEKPGPGSDEATMSAPPSGTQPAAYELVPYTRAPLGGAIGTDQYTINYDTGVIDLGTNINVTDPLAASLPQRTTVLVAFSYQNNDELSSANVASPDTVKASYQTEGKVQVSIGIRLYDASNGHPTYFSLSNAVDVNNSSR